MRLTHKRRNDWLVRDGSTPFFQFQTDLRTQADVFRLGAGQPLVLLPGLAGGASLVAPIASQLAENFEVLIPRWRDDWRVSFDARARTIADHARDVAHVIERLGLERPIVFGVSFGGAVALQLAVDYPHRLGSLVLSGVASRYEWNLGASIAVRVLENYPLPRENRFLNQFFNLLHGRRPDPGPVADFVVDRCWQTDQSVIAERIRSLRDFNVTDRLQRVAVPTLVLAGERDVIVPAREQRELVAELPRCGCTVIKDAGHIGFVTHATQMASTVCEFHDRVAAVCTA